MFAQTAAKRRRLAQVAAECKEILTSKFGWEDDSDDDLASDVFHAPLPDLECAPFDPYSQPQPLGIGRSMEVDHEGDLLRFGGAGPSMEVHDDPSHTDTLIMVITDPGEEVDDEAAVFYLEQQELKLDCDIHYICVGPEKGRSRVRVNRLKEMVTVRCPDERIHTIEEWLSTFGIFKEDEYKNVRILQIGPIANKWLPSVKAYTDYLKGEGVTYDYYLQGALGSTTNSRKPESDMTAKRLCDNATVKQEILGPYEMFTYKIATGSGFERALENEILRIGFKNTVGRAPPKYAHLVGPGGANYETAKSIYDGIMGRGQFELIDFNDYTEILKRSVAEYFTPDISHTVKQAEGLKRMLYAFYILFELPMEKVLRSDDPMLSEERLTSDDQSSSIKETFNAFKAKLEQNPDIQLTPMYDVKAAQAVVDGVPPSKTAFDQMDVKARSAQMLELQNLVSGINMGLFSGGS